MPEGREIEIEGRQLRLSNLDKPLYPDGFTKAQVIDYYVRIAPVMLPHLAGRPLTLKRYPNGTGASFFYEKNCPSHRPDWVGTIPIPSRRGSDKMINYCLADDLPTLVWLANLAAIELHPLLARRPDVERPTTLVFDLDPGPPAGMGACAEVAMLVRQVLGRWDLEAYPKTSGSKGLQMYVPLNTAVSYDDTKSLAHGVAAELTRSHPRLVVERMDKSVRGGKVLIDWSQNHPTKTTVAVYSLRARERPTVSTPVSWDEVERAASDPDADLSFDAAAVLERVSARGDLFAEVADRRQEIPADPGPA
ncbi:MAG TPA: non-homologous end-joining DNA ligase [Acidimicrobiales bacterium]|nr:non-homologous end-joining DNA ligase [Acidimicrobiales bacterium]